MSIDNVVNMRIRFPKDLHTAISNEATSRNRSYHAQILWMLERYLAASVEFTVDVGGDITCPQCGADIFTWDENESLRSNK